MGAEEEPKSSSTRREEEEVVGSREVESSSPTLRIDVLTIFPQLFEPFLAAGMVARARQKSAESPAPLQVRLTDLRAFTENRHRSVDDRPYGGGPGMVIKPEPVFRALELLFPRRGDAFLGEGGEAELLVMCPQGERLCQEHLEQWAGVSDTARPKRLVLLCGRYEGFDQRIFEAFPWRRVSMGDFVVSGGEVPAMLLIEGVARLLPGVLGHEESARRDSFNEWSGPDGLDHPHWTRPEEYRGQEVPSVLLSGNHGEIEAWRRRRASIASQQREERGTDRSGR